MAQLRHYQQEFIDRSIQVVVIGPESPSAFKNYFEEHDLPFTGIADPKGQVLKAFGQEVNLFKLGRMPAEVLVNTEGIALFAHYGHSMSDIPDPKVILNAIDVQG